MPGSNHHFLKFVVGVAWRKVLKGGGFSVLRDRQSDIHIQFSHNSLILTISLLTLVGAAFSEKLFSVHHSLSTFPLCEGDLSVGSDLEWFLGLYLGLILRCIDVAVICICYKK